MAASVAFVIGMNALQVVSLYGRLTIGWPPAVRRLLDVFAIVNVSMELVAPDCVNASKSSGFFLRYLLTMFVPAVAATLLVVYYGVFVALSRSVWRSLSNHQNEFVRALRQTAVQALVVFYLPLVSTSLEYFDCVPNGTGALAVATAPDVVCGQPSWNRGLVAAIVFFILYGLVTPAAAGYVLWKERARLSATDFTLRYGFLTSRYRESTYFYELVVIAKKLAVSVAITFVSSSPYIQAGAAVTVLLFAFVGHVHSQPYGCERHNRLESAASTVVEIILFFGIMFQDDTFSTAAVSAIM